MYAKFLAFVTAIMLSSVLYGQVNYSYVDPCTGITKTITVPSNGITVTYYGQINTFQANDFYNGAFETWAQGVYGSFGGNNPCASVIGLPTGINIAQGTTLNFISIVNSIDAISSLAGSGSTDILSGAQNSTRVDKKENKNGSNSNNSSVSGNGGNGNVNQNSSNQTQGNQGQGQPQGSNGSVQTNQPQGNGNGNGNGSQGQGGQESNPSGGTTGGSGSQSGQNTGGSGVNPNNESGSQSGGSTGNTSGNTSGSGGAGNGSNNNGTTTNTTEDGGGGKTNILGSSVSSSQGATSNNNNQSNKNGNRPSVIASSDFVGFNFKNSDVSYGGKFTGGYTALRWDGARSYGVLVDYTTAIKGPNISGFYAFMRKKRIDLISTSLTLGFDTKPSIYGTLVLGQMWSFGKQKKAKALYMLSASSGSVYGEPFLGTAAIAGTMYDFKIGKRIDIKLMGLYVYAPYVSYYNDILLKSPHVVLPIIGTNIGITKKFKLNINGGGAWAIQENALNYTVMMGTRFLL
jgi:hypothetical protein